MRPCCGWCCCFCHHLARIILAQINQSYIYYKKNILYTSRHQHSPTIFFCHLQSSHRSFFLLCEWSFLCVPSFVRLRHIFIQFVVVVVFSFLAFVAGIVENISTALFFSQACLSHLIDVEHLCSRRSDQIISFSIFFYELMFMNHDDHFRHRSLINIALTKLCIPSIALQLSSLSSSSKIKVKDKLFQSRCVCRSHVTAMVLIVLGQIVSVAHLISDMKQSICQIHSKWSIVWLAQLGT